MSTVTISAADVSAAADFLESFMGDAVPDGDFTRGTALRDIAVQAIASVVAYMRADAAQVRQLQSLNSVAAATEGDAEALRDSVVAIMSNLLITPNSGVKSRGFAVGHSTQQVDVFIPTTTRFTRSAGAQFVVDSDTTYFIPATELIANVDATGAVLDYEFRIPLIATATGEGYNIQPGLFAAFDRFNPYVTRIENIAEFSGGRGSETVDELLARAPTAISVRNLVNSRSIASTLQSTYPEIEALFSVGMGDAEMQRDVVPTLAPALKFHVGGAVDVYLRTALVETSFSGEVGALFARSDGLATVFTDPFVSFASVNPGDIIRITSGLPSVPAEFMVIENQGTRLIVGDRNPFPIASDEGVPPTTVSYTIGNTAPQFSNVVSDVGNQPYTTGITSRRVASSGRITLPGGPVMDILDVAILDPVGEASFISPDDGLIHFETHVSTTPSDTVTPSEGFQFQTVVHNPLYAQSNNQWMEIVVGTDLNTARFDGRTLQVRYRTLQSFDAIDSFVRGPRERILAAHHVPRAHHPVTVSLTLKYTLLPTAATLLDSTAIVQTIVDYINSRDASDAPIDVSAIIQLVRNTYPDIGNIVPATTGDPLLTLTYTLRAPTGDVLTYQTTDVVSVDATKQVAGPVSLSLAEYGVTSRTLRYIANQESVIVEQVF